MLMSTLLPLLCHRERAEVMAAAMATRRPKNNGFIVHKERRYTRVLHFGVCLCRPLRRILVTCHLFVEDLSSSVNISLIIFADFLIDAVSTDLVPACVVIYSARSTFMVLLP